MCKKCGDDRCSGSYLLHSKELRDRWGIMAKELYVNPRRKFVLIDSPSSGEVFTRFYELHVLDNVSVEEAGTYEDHRCDGALVLTNEELLKHMKVLV